jgi:hypothetical protein
VDHDACSAAGRRCFRCLGAPVERVACLIRHRARAPHSAALHRRRFRTTCRHNRWADLIQGAHLALEVLCITCLPVFRGARSYWGLVARAFGSEVLSRGVRAVFGCATSPRGAATWCIVWAHSSATLSSCVCASVAGAHVARPRGDCSDPQPRGVNVACVAPHFLAPVLI